MRRYLVSVIAAMSSVSVQAAPVSIDGSAIGTNGAGRTSLGFTVSSTTRPYEGIGTQVAVLPYFSAVSGHFYVSGLNLGYQIVNTGQYTLDVIAVPRFLGYKEKDSEVLQGLSDTNYSVHGGLSLGADLGLVKLNAQLLTDILSESSGTEFIGTVSRTFKLDKLNITPAFSASWQDDSLVDHYYGIGLSQATQTREVYSGESTLNTALSLTASYQWSDAIHAIGTIRSDRYGDEIADSPIVDSSSSSSVTVGLVYSF